MSVGTLPIFLLAIAVPVLLVLLAVAAVRRRDGRIPEEAGRTPVHEETGGARIDGFNATIPLARITLYDDLLVVSSFRRAVIPLEALRGVEARRVMVSTGVHLDVPVSYPEVILWSTNPGRLAEVIRGQLERSR